VSTWSAEVSTWSAEVSTWSATSVWHVDGRTSPAAGASGDRVVEMAERYSRGGGVFSPFARPDPRGVILSSAHDDALPRRSPFRLQMTELNPFCVLD
jgi:hypothetical protein